MSVEMGIKNKRTGKYRTLPVATSQAFRDYCFRRLKDWVYVWCHISMTVL